MRAGRCGTASRAPASWSRVGASPFPHAPTSRWRSPIGSPGPSPPIWIAKLAEIAEPAGRRPSAFGESSTDSQPLETRRAYQLYSRVRFVLGDDGIIPTRSAAKKLGESLPGWTADRLRSFTSLLADLSVLREDDKGRLSVGELAAEVRLDLKP